jgi:uncharacterized membrane protein
MDKTLLIHIVAGGVSLLSGYVALYAAKGASLHRKSGRLFVYAMLVMALVGAAMAALRGRAPALNVPAALLSAYLVTTALTTVRSAGVWPRRVDRMAVVLAFGISLFTLDLGIEAIANGGKRHGMPAFPYLMFGIVALIAGVGDVRMLRVGGLQGAPRLARHLWRMSFALLIAAMSFFFGQADVIPKVFRIPALLASPVVAVLLTMLFWLWRVRRKQSLRSIANVITQTKELA